MADDLALLQRFDEPSVLALIKQRYTNFEIYTWVNAMLLAINPYCDLGLYTPEAMLRHTGYAAEERAPPHAFGVAASAFKGLLGGQNQCILVTGESGSGKTETCRRVLQFLAHSSSTSAARANALTLHEELDRSNCMLEAFGNAVTTMNNNSSRFGKFLTLRFTNGSLVTASVRTYLLEKTRVAMHAAGERTFHIFYMMLDGFGGAEARELFGNEGASAKQFKYTTGAGGAAGAPEGDSATLREVSDALEGLGVPQHEQWGIWRCLAAILSLGNIDFDGQEAAAVSAATEAQFQRTASLLGVGAEALRQSIVSRCIQAGSEFINTPTTAEAASALRHGLSKAIYSRIFSLCVERMNASLGRVGSVTSSGLGGERFIGILDIFGFETFASNSLEQLLINYTNEQLQAVFNEIIFKAAQQENEAEGLPADAMDEESVSNREVVELLGAPRTGLIALLDEECVFPKGTAASFVSKWTAANSKNPRLLPPPKGGDEASFRVRHFAADVAYGASDFLAKNRDPLSEDQQVVLRKSALPLIAAAFAKDLAPPSRSRGGFRGVALKFSTELEQLLRQICSSRVRFIRCIKPNLAKAPRDFDEETVLRQLRCSGVMEAVRVYSAGYPDRLLLSEFVGGYSAIGGVGAAAGGAKEAAAALMGKLGFSTKDYALGHSKLFLRPGVHAKLRALREAAMLRRLTRCQAALRGGLARKRTRAKLAEAHRAHALREREAARQAELAKLEAEQQAERKRAQAASEARQAEVAAAAMEAAKKAAAAREVEERAAQEAAAARRQEMSALREAIASEAGRREALEAKLAQLGQSLAANEAECAALRQESAAARAAALEAERYANASVELHRAHAELAAQRAAHAEEKLALITTQAPRPAPTRPRGEWPLAAQIRELELREEISLYRERFHDLAMKATAVGALAHSSKGHSLPADPGPGVGPMVMEALGSFIGNFVQGAGNAAQSAGPLLKRASVGAQDLISGIGQPPQLPRAVFGATQSLRPDFVPPIHGLSNVSRTPPTNANTRAAAEQQLFTPRLRSPSEATAEAREQEMVKEYMIYLGLHPERDAELVWIAEEAARAPLPEGWRTQKDPEGHPYYEHEATGETSRQHPCDNDFREMVARAKLERKQAANVPSAGSWSTVKMKTLEQSLCAATEAQMMAVVERGVTEHGVEEFSFDVRLDAESRLTCFNAHYVRGSSLPTFTMKLDTLAASGKPTKEKHDFFTRVLSRGKYSLVRSTKPKSIISHTSGLLGLGGGEREEELGAALFSQPIRGVHTMELVIPFASSGVKSRFVQGAESLPLLATYTAGSTDNLMVFVGAIDVVAAGVVRTTLSLPKTNSANIVLRCNAGGSIDVSYAAPLASVHAFLAALALAHWLDTAAPASVMMP
ncbi:hypothetical protein AB1Y20_003408 [Prymnesium parvum]|uniref:Myosin motor domain-containing protein n=1 Tax=Prymnesium parvum TaxID=97485 RepID=A0AB34JDK5_PRYPA